MGFGKVAWLTFEFYVLLTFGEHTFALSLFAVIMNGIADPPFRSCQVSPGVRDVGGDL